MPGCPAGWRQRAPVRFSRNRGADLPDAGRKKFCFCAFFACLPWKGGIYKSGFERGEVSELVEGARLEIVCTLKAYREFESLPLRQQESKPVEKSTAFFLAGAVIGRGCSAAGSLGSPPALPAERRGERTAWTFQTGTALHVRYADPVAIGVPIQSKQTVMERGRPQTAGSQA